MSKKKDLINIVDKAIKEVDRSYYLDETDGAGIDKQTALMVYCFFLGRMRTMADIMNGHFMDVFAQDMDYASNIRNARYAVGMVETLNDLWYALDEKEKEENSEK